MNKSDITNTLDEFGTLLEIKGENPFKSRAFYNASRILATIPDDINRLVEEQEIQNIKGIGKSIASIIEELVSTGKSIEFENLKNEFPTGVFEMLKIPGIGPKKVSFLLYNLKIQSVEELESACKAGKLENAAGFGKKTQENILHGIEFLKKHSSRFLYNVAESSAAEILDILKKQKGVLRAEIAGSLRRRKETIGDIDILVSAQKKYISQLMDVFTSYSSVERIIGKGETKSSVMLKNGINCDLRIVHDNEFPFALNYFTGSKEHNVRLRSIAKDIGLSLNEYGFTIIDSKSKKSSKKNIPTCKTEKDIYKTLGLNYIEPELREDFGEIEASQHNKLPKLITLNDLQGTFHCHTTYSDGKNTLSEMALAAQNIGWKYLGIADHSKVAVYANGLDAKRVTQQLNEIDSLNAKLKNFYIFKGTEVDILPNGELDYSDKILSSFEFVVASVHSNFSLNEKEMTKRIIRALKNKYVTILGHLTGRLLLQREEYQLNKIDIINAAADYGKIIEINSHPMRLDLDWRLCKYAKEKGVKISINPDAHNIKGLNDVRYGVGIARKGWLEKQDVVNTLSVDKIRKLFNKSR